MYYIGVQMPKEKAISGVVRPTKKMRFTTAVYAGKTSTLASAQLLQPTALPPTGSCHINLPTPRVKNRPPFPEMRPLVKICMRHMLEHGVSQQRDLVKLNIHLYHSLVRFKANRKLNQ